MNIRVVTQIIEDKNVIHTPEIWINNIIKHAGS